MKLLARAAIALALAAAPLAVQAQNPANDTLIYGQRAPRWAGNLTALTSNVVLGALTSGVLQKARGGSFRDGFTRGALGGTFTYAGKWTAARRFDGAGFIGREVAAVGSSIIRNASEARPSFDQVVFPFGPVRVHVTPARRAVSATIDVFATAWTIYGIAQDELDFNLGESVSAGTPVFQTRNKLIVQRGSRFHAGGFTAAGVIMQSHVPAWGVPFLERVLAHERVHVEQEDQLLQTLTEPAEDWLVRKFARNSTVLQHMDFNISTEILALLANLFPSHIDRPWELEAIYLSR